MAYTELHDAPTLGRDRDGQVQAVRSFRVYGVAEQAAIFSLAQDGEVLLPKVSTHPRITNLLLDSYSTSPSGPDTIVTARYNNQNATGGTLDPLDEFFGTWTVGFRTVKVGVPTIVLEESVLSLSDETTVSTQFWNLGPEFEIEQTQPIFTWQGNDDGLADGSVSLSLAAAATVWGQAGKLHRLGLGGSGGPLWKFEPRQVRQAIKGKFIVDYSWVLETDITLTGPGGEPITDLGGSVVPQSSAPLVNGGQWYKPNGSASFAIPVFPSTTPGQTDQFVIQPAYSTIIVSPDRSVEPSPTSPPLLSYQIARVVDENGYQLLPGLF